LRLIELDGRARHAAFHQEGVQDAQKVRVDRLALLAHEISDYMFWLIEGLWEYMFFNMDKKTRQERDLLSHPDKSLLRVARRRVTGIFGGSTLARPARYRETARGRLASP
jgi:hypothetical protein